MRVSAGLLPFTSTGGHTLVFIGHMGGPFWLHKDRGAWSIIKGEFNPGGETPRHAAAREWVEETGSAVPGGAWTELGTVTYPKRAKVVHGFAVRVADPRTVRFVASSPVTTIWPPGSDQRITFPEIDRAQWCELADARERLVAAQSAFLDRLPAAESGSPG